MLSACIIIFIIIAGIYLFAISPETSRKGQLDAYRGTMFAHRGYHCKEKGIPENSLAAFRAAIRKNYGIELDIHLTGDGQIIVFHDDTLKRVCGVNKRPEKLSLSQLKKYSLLGTKERIPTLAEALSLVDGRVPLLIEIKMPEQDPRVCEQAYQLLKSYHGLYMVQSFNTLALHWFLQNAPHVLRGQLASNLTKNDHKPHWLFRYLAKHLLLNFWGRPDFISYKLSDLPTFNTTVLRKVLNTPFAVWTLRDRHSLEEGVRNYDMQIFEKSCENY